MFVPNAWYPRDWRNVLQRSHILTNAHMTLSWIPGQETGEGL